jgi:hypothetical protein
LRVRPNRDAVDQLFPRRDPLAVQGHDLVTGLDAGLGGGLILLHRADERARLEQ